MADFERFRGDLIDMAQAADARNLADALRAVPVARVPLACGACLYCGEGLVAGLRWCLVDVLNDDGSESCAQLWEHEQRRRAIPRVVE